MLTLLTGSPLELPMVILSAKELSRYIYTTFPLSIHYLMEIQAVSWILWIENQWTWVRKNLCNRISISGCMTQIHRNYVVDLCLGFQGFSTLISLMPAWFCPLILDGSSSLFSHIHISACLNVNYADWVKNISLRMPVYFPHQYLMFLLTQSTCV